MRLSDYDMIAKARNHLRVSSLPQLNYTAFIENIFSKLPNQSYIYWSDFKIAISTLYLSRNPTHSPHI